MALYTPESKERVRDAVDFAEVVSARTELRRAGVNRLEGLCPFHDERTPSFGIDPVKKVYHCFGCGMGGDVFRFVQETEGLDFPAAMEALADRYGVELEREQEDPEQERRRHRRERLLELLERSAGYYARYLWEADEAANAREYLAARGLGEETLRAFRVGYSPSAWDHMLVRSRRAGFTEEELRAAGLAQRSKERGTLYDRFRGRLMFPLADARGRVLGFGARALRDNQQPKYLNSGEGEVYHKGRQLFGADLARAQAARDQLVILVEGYTDVLAMHQAGLANAVGLMGTALTEHQVAELSRLTGADGRVVLALDADASGQEAMERAARVAAGRDLDLRVVELPAGADPADLVTSEGADAMRKRVEGSMPFARFRVERVLDASDTSSADGRDRALARVREAISPLPPSALREELVRLVAGRLGLSEQLVGSLTATTGPTPAPPARPGAPGPAAAGGRARVALDRREQIERTFLALCIALPEAGRDALRRVDLDSHFTNGLLRRAAAHLREHLVAPLDGIAVGDGELESLLAELSLRAAGEPAEPATLEVQTLQLETARLEREIAMARASGSLDVSDYAETLSRVRQDLDDAMDRAMEARPAEPAG